MTFYCFKDSLFFIFSIFVEKFLKAFKVRRLHNMTGLTFKILVPSTTYGEGQKIINFELPKLQFCFHCLCGTVCIAMAKGRLGGVEGKVNGRGEREGSACSQSPQKSFTLLRKFHYNVLFPLF